MEKGDVVMLNFYQNEDIHMSKFVKIFNFEFMHKKPHNYFLYLYLLNLLIPT